MNYYRFDIHTENDISTYNAITNLLQLSPKNVNQKDEFAYSIWAYEIETDSKDEPFDFINNFLDILEPKFEELAKIQINKDNITFWFLYEYDQQCNMEFNPREMKRLGENEITLCISCWEK